MEGPIENSVERVRLAFGAFLWRSFVILAMVGEFVLWASIRRQGRGAPPELRLVWLISHTPRVLFLAFFLAAVLTVVVDCGVRLFVERWLRRWLSPRIAEEDDTDQGFSFYLDATEQVVEVLPVRRLGGRRSEPGRLVLTDRRVWFFPLQWESEPWSMERDRVRSSLAGAPGLVGGLILGLPPRVILGSLSEPDSGSTFALTDPRRVSSWFEAGAVPRG